MDLLLLFITLNIINVILSTIRSIATVKCSPFIASLVNAISYGVYTIVLVYTNCELNLWVKVAVVALTNLIGVYIVKLIEKKIQKDKLWKIDMTINSEYSKGVCDTLTKFDIPYSYNTYGKHTMFSIFCQTQSESAKVAELVKIYNGKYFVSENKSVLY